MNEEGVTGTKNNVDAIEKKENVTKWPESVTKCKYQSAVNIM